RAERIEPCIDRVVLLGEAGEMAHHLRLAETRRADRALPLEAGEAAAERRRRGQVGAAMPPRILGEGPVLLGLQPMVADDRLRQRRRIIGFASTHGPAPIVHDSTSRKPCSSRSMSSVVVSSVAATSRRSATASLSG